MMAASSQPSYPDTIEQSYQQRSEFVLVRLLLVLLMHLLTSA